MDPDNNADVRLRPHRRPPHVVVRTLVTGRRYNAAHVCRDRALHPYELPELIAVEAVGGLAPYLEWVVQQTRHDD